MKRKRCGLHNTLALWTEIARCHWNPLSVQQIVNKLLSLSSFFAALKIYPSPTMEKREVLLKRLHVRVRCYILYYVGLYRRPSLHHRNTIVQNGVKAGWPQHSSAANLRGEEGEVANFFLRQKFSFVVEVEVIQRLTAACLA